MSISRFVNSLVCSLRMLPLLICINGHTDIVKELRNACDKHKHKKEFGRIARLLCYYPEYRNLVYYRLKKGDHCFWDYLYPRSKTLLLWNERIGDNLVLWHPFSTCLGGTIGNNCIIRQNTTIGNSGLPNSGNPTLGENVDVGCGVNIIGDVHIGNNVTIGAGTVIVKDVPDNVVVVGNPARIVRYK